LIEKEINEAKIASHKIILGGFSQGAASALYSGLQLDHQLAGIIAMSGYLPLPKSGDTSSLFLSESNKATPILMCHGDADQVVRFNWGKKSLVALQSLLGEKAVDFHVYPGMAHSACMEEIQEVIKFVRRTILTEKL
jgi:predicted esterase